MNAAARCFFISLCASPLIVSGEVALSGRLPPDNLLLYHKRSGEIAPVKDKSDWQKRRREIVQGMESIMGPLPGKLKRCPLDAKIESEVDRGSYVCRLITYSSEPGSRVPAYLLIPKLALGQRKKFPGVLALHPTDMQHGHRVLVEQMRPQYPTYANELAEHGFVVLAPAYPLLANYEPELEGLGYRSGTMKAIWDNMRGLDLLDSMSFVKKGHYAALGHSLGGHNSIFTAVFDTRIRVVVSSCGFDSFRDYMNGEIKGWTSQRYMPRLLDYKSRLGEIPFDFAELLGALAPRMVFVNAPLRDSNFKWSSVDQIVRAASQVYNLYGKPDRLRLEHPDCGHDFPPQVREEAYGLIGQSLR